jgi:hypothetical protein
MISQDTSFFPVIDETPDKATGVLGRIVLRTRQVNCVIPESPTTIVITPQQAEFATLLTCETLGDCPTFQTYAYTGISYNTGTTVLSLTSLNGNQISVSGITGGGGSGSSGTSGSSGQNGTSGSSGVSGSSGTSGTRGSSGSSGVSGISGTSGSSGQNGVNGTSGSSGQTGTSGSSGQNGTSGSSGANGTNGTSGSSGANGGTGTSGTSGSSGTSPLNQIAQDPASPNSIVYLWSGSQAQYNALTPNSNTIYFIV